MKEHIFNKFIEAISEHTGIDSESIFKKSKESDIVLARQMLFYLCRDRNMTTTEILKYMRTNGYDIGFNAISYGLKVIDNLKKNDKDYEVLINKLSSID